MAIDVFVSYHTATSLDTAKAVVQKLESQGLHCWYQDRDSHGKFGGVIKRAIEECGAFVVILNGQSARSRHVLNEVALAFDREELELLPLRMTSDSLGDDMDTTSTASIRSTATAAAGRPPWRICALAP